MPEKVTRECERCGHQWQEWDRVAKRDEELAHLHDDYLENEAHLRALLHLAHLRLAACRERIDQLRELVNSLPDPAPVRLEEREGCPF